METKRKYPLYRRVIHKEINEADLKKQEMKSFQRQRM